MRSGCGGERRWGSGGGGSGRVGGVGGGGGGGLVSAVLTFAGKRLPLGKKKNKTRIGSSIGSFRL